MKSVLRSTFTTQGELGQRCPSEVQIRAPRGLAVIVTSLSVPRVMVLQAPRHRPTAAIVNIKVFMVAPLVRWLRNGRADGPALCILEEGGTGMPPPLRVSGAQSLPFSYLNDTFSLVRNSSTLPSLSCTSCTVTSAMRRSRSDSAARSTAVRAAFSHDSLLVPISSMTL